MSKQQQSPPQQSANPKNDIQPPKPKAAKATRFALLAVDVQAETRGGEEGDDDDDDDVELGGRASSKGIRVHDDADVHAHKTTWISHPCDCFLNI